MKTLWWQTVGTGNCHLVLLHGWGLNAEVWRCVSEELASQFTLHLVDLPGYGRSRGFGAMSLDEMAQQVLDTARQNGGLEILKTIDLREQLASLALPHLRMYGYLDGLVPRKVVPLLDNLWPESQSMVVAKAAHAPFISHPGEFCSALSAFIRAVPTTP